MRMECSEAIRAMRKYLDSEIAYPFFVAANASTDLRAVFNALPDAVGTIRASDYCTQDGFPDEDALFDALLQARAPVLLRGIGECAMLSGNATFLQRLADKTFAQKVIVLCRNQGPQLERLHQLNSKFGANRWCELAAGSDLSIVRVMPGVPIEPISGLKALLRQMEEFSSGKLYVATEVDILCERTIASAYDAILEREPSFPVPQSALSDAQWLEYLANPQTETDDPFHWRYYLRLRLLGAQTPYFQLVLRCSPDYERYRKEIFNAILRVPHTSDTFPALYRERKKFLKQHAQVDVSEYIRDTRVRDIERIHYLTDNTMSERRAIIEEVAHHGLHMDVLARVYPDLAAYFADYQFTCSEAELLTDYFIRYKEQKAGNRLDEGFLKQVAELSKPGERKYNELPTRNQIVERIRDDGSGLFWLDALGVEYLGYIMKLAGEMKLWLEVHIGRASLPTLTEFNRSFYDNWTGFKFQKEAGLDDLKHYGTPAQTSSGAPVHLADEMEIIRKVLQEIKTCLTTDDKVKNVLLVSDHGASRLCVLNKHENKWKIKTWEMEVGSKHSGRCCPVRDADECPESATKDGDNRFWVLANYDRFKGGRMQNVEVHGGASLEEVVVPVIKISLAEEEIRLRILSEGSELPGAEDEIATVIKPLDGPILMRVFCSKASAKLTLKINGRYYAGEQSENNPNIFAVNLSTCDELWSTSTVYEAEPYIGDNPLDIKLRFRLKRVRGITRNDRDGTDFFS